MTFKKRRSEISEWFEVHSKKVPIPFLSSITIKDSGFKVAVNNFQLFPSGLHHLHPNDLAKAPGLIKKYFKRFHEDLGKLKKILLLVSTRHPNPFFYDHLDTLCKLLKKSGLTVKVATLEPLSKPVEVQTSAHKSISIAPSHVENNRLVSQGFDPEFILVIDQFSREDLTKLLPIAQPVIPHRRALHYVSTKVSDSLHLYNTLATDLADKLGMDPWLISTPFAVETHVNFEEKSGIEKVAKTSQELLVALSEKYQKYHLNRLPMLQIRNNLGTFGMGRLLIKSSKDLNRLYLEKKKKKTQTKSATVISDVIIQEEIPTRPLFDHAVGEIVVYLIGNEILGGYLRNYAQISEKNVKKARSDLFAAIQFSGNGKTIRFKKKAESHGLLYQNVSRLGSLALGYEIDKKI
ncbi:MAG: glutamate--cysteine ligase [Deltaproteobacteria bacterium]|nr:glutamate--cysteine ligase [Deltaproteobacteria bacterium]